jgi:gas vesicle protein GvpL/GvpF
MVVQSPPGDGAKAASETALYCYGVTWAESAQSQKGAGVGGESVEPVCQGEVAALASPVESTHVRARRADLLRHSDVLTAALGRGTTLPLRFGVAFPSEAALIEDFLRPRHDELVGLLREFEGRVELTVRAFYGEEEILAEIVRENPRIASLQAATRVGGVSTYPLKVELGERVARELQERMRRDRQALLDHLRPLALAIDVDQEPIAYQVLRASFLVERKRVPKFDETMDELARSQAGRMDFKYIGPLAPHSFASLTAAEGQ